MLTYLYYFQCGFYVYYVFKKLKMYYTKYYKYFEYFQTIDYSIAYYIYIEGETISFNIFTNI